MPTYRMNRVGKRPRRIAMRILVWMLAGGGMGAEIASQEPRFEVHLFDLAQVPLDAAERRTLSDGLVKVAYFLSDQPGKSGRALALAESLTPQHPGVRVASFRLRRGSGSGDVPMLVVDETATVLLQGAARILERCGGQGEGMRAAAFLVDMAQALPLQNGALTELRERLARKVPAPDWSTAVLGDGATRR